MTKEAFETELLKIERSLYVVCRTYFSSPQDCADAVQESILKGWEHKEGLKHLKYFKTWMTKILINTCVDMLRENKKQAHDELKEENIQKVSAQKDLEESKACDTLFIQDALKALNQEQYIVLVMYYLEGYKIKDIAHILDIPLGTVSSRLRYAKRHMEMWAKQDKQLMKGGM